MDKQEVQQNLAQIMKATNRAKDLVKQILTFSRRGEQEKKPVRLDLLLKENLKFLRASIPSTIEIDFNPDSGPVITMADPTQIHQIMMNLCTNAFQAMREKEGGRLKISVSVAVIEHDSIDDAGDEIKAGRYGQLTIEDNGPGIPSSVIPRIFEPFYTTKPKGEGTGLGLSVVSGIVKSHEGFIRVHSQMDQGTVFEVYLPLLASHETKEPEKNLRILPHGHGERILVIDDKTEIVNVHQKFLKQLGYEAISETDSLAALELFRQQPDYFQVVLTDQTMPNQTGLHLAKEIHNIRPDIPVILCTGYSDHLSEEKAKECGIWKVLLKPIELQEMADALAMVLKLT
jgi:two-component system, cell cycle sensor histidine kinase and response regulator CckA